MPKVTLPPLANEAAAHSMQLEKLIAEKISSQGAMRFSEFMQHVLYTPHLGYYNSSTVKFGKHGDFTTAPELSPIFAYAVAEQCAEILRPLSSPSILEFGAGSGRLAVGILQHLEKLNCLPHEYLILEVSSYLKERQQQTIAKELPHLLSKVRWINSLPVPAICGVVLANEVIDAMPVQRFRVQNDVIEEAYVRYANNSFAEYFLASDDPQVQGLVTEIIPGLIQPYVSEVNLALPAWINSVYDILQQGVMLIIDYGFPRAEYYHFQRSEGTLMCHYQHLAHSDPYVYVGLQDITAHVDFTALAHSAVNAGWQVAGYTNQASFLLANNLLEYATNAKLDTAARLQLNNAIKMLTLPHEMGELFKVIALSKQYDEPLQGFKLLDQRHRL